MAEVKYYTITLTQARVVDASPLNIERTLGAMTGLWNDPANGVSRTKAFIMKTAARGQKGEQFLKAIRLSIGRKTPLVRDAEIKKTYDALSTTISRFVSRM